MFYAIGIALAALIILFIVLYIKHRKRLAKELEQKIYSFHEKVNIFFSEYFELLKNRISESVESDFSKKWENLFSEIQQYHIPQKLDSSGEIEHFSQIYKNLHRIIADSNAEIKRKEEIHSLSEQINHFFTDLFESTNKYISNSEKKQFIQKWEEFSRIINNTDIRKDDQEYEEFERFKTVCKSLSDYFETSNETFIQNESSQFNELFSNIDGKSLDEQQRRAVITDEDRILVLAGAGSGKTLTISAKVKYLCEVKHIKPSEILLISFTKKSALEMTERIQNRLGIPCEATTFHKLGLDIIKNVDGQRPEISDENGLNQFVHNFFENELLNHPDLIKDLTEYFTYFLEIPDNMEDYSSLGELYEEEKTADLETLKSKYDREKYIRKTGAEKAKAYTTLNNEQVKSIEETKIANYLFMHDINYEYEKLYPFESPDPLRKAYHPDFYLTYRL